jgi:hypothetical protein
MTSPHKPLSQFHPNFTGMFLWWSPLYTGEQPQGHHGPLVCLKAECDEIFRFGKLFSVFMLTTIFCYINGHKTFFLLNFQTVVRIVLHWLLTRENFFKKMLNYQLGIDKAR